MINVTDILALMGLLVLRIGVPIAIMAGLVYFLKRLDQRWEAEARAQRPAERPAEWPVQRPVERPAVAEPMRQAVRVDLPGRPKSFDPTRRTPQGIAASPDGKFCWDVKHCSEAMMAKCAAPAHPDVQCWQARLQAEGHIPESCPSCEIFQQYPL